MVSAIGMQDSRKINKRHGFYSTPELEKAIEESHATLIEPNVLNKSRIQVDKFFNAVTVYPAKGLSGSPNANFYEFLTMGMVPYLIGSGMLMAVFNLATKYFEPSKARHARMRGAHMALGVIFYGLFKSLSKKFIEVPVRLKTGIDMNLPYKDMKAQLPERPDDNAEKKSVEYHKVFESVDFPRWDLLYDYKKGKPRNYYYDNVAKKMGLGEKLVASDQAAKPKIRETVIKTRTWTTLTSYLWAGLGVALAMQEAWTPFLVGNNDSTGILERAMAAIKNKEKGLSNKVKAFCSFVQKTCKDAVVAFGTSCKQLVSGGAGRSHANVLAGRLGVATVVGATLFGIFKSAFDVSSGAEEQNKAEINYNKDYMVG